MSQIRLYLSYFLVLLFLAMGGFGISAWFHAKRLELVVEAQDAKQKQLVEANEQQATAIDALKKVRASDEIVLKGLSQDIDNLRGKDSATTMKIAALERNSAAVKALFDTLLPAGGCVLDDSCDPNGSGQDQAPGVNASAVPGTGRDPVRHRP